MEPYSLSTLPRIFQRSNNYERMEIEIGCGNGHFLSEYGVKNKNTFIMGIEKKENRCAKTMKKINQLSLKNAAVIMANAEEVLEYLPQSIVDRYHIYFPDPWPKTKHRKRRFFKMSSLNRIFTTLRTGGIMHFSSDIFDYFLQTKIIFILHRGFRISSLPPPSEFFISIYAEKFKYLEKPIYHISAIKNNS